MTPSTFINSFDACVGHAAVTIKAADFDGMSEREILTALMNPPYKPLIEKIKDNPSYGGNFRYAAEDAARAIRSRIDFVK